MKSKFSFVFLTIFQFFLMMFIVDTGPMISIASDSQQQQQQRSATSSPRANIDPKIENTLIIGFLFDNVEPEYRGIFRVLNFEEYSNWDESRTKSVDYMAISVLGQGSFGTVVAAQDMKTGEKIALKFLHELVYVNGVIPEIEFIPIFKQLNNFVNIAGPTDAFKYGKEDVVVTRLFYTDVLKMIHEKDRKNEIWSLDSLQRFAFEVSSAIRTLHMRRIVHADIKPNNIFATFDGHYYLGDFGLTFMLPLKMKPDWGTPKYLPPETLAGSPMGPKDDMWALGATLFIMTIQEFHQYYEKRSHSIMEKIFHPVAKDLKMFMREKGQEMEVMEFCFEVAKDEKIKEEMLEVMDNAYKSDSARYELLKDFISKLLHIDPNVRMTSEQAFGHPFILDYTLRI